MAYRPIHIVSFLLLAGFGTSSQMHAQATIEGAVPMLRAAPAPMPGTNYKIKAGEIAPAPPPSAVVYLEGEFAAVKPQDKPIIMGQKGYQFEHGVLAVQTGTRIEFPNNDDDYHNVFSYSKAKRFDLGRYRKNETPPALVFDTAGVVRLYCEIHEHMRGVILVLDTPHFTNTKQDGSFAMKNLPAGDFTLKAWLNEKTTLQQAVTLKAGQTLRVDFSGKVAATR